MSSVVLAREAGDDSRGNPVSQVPKPLITEAKDGQRETSFWNRSSRRGEAERDRGRQRAGQRSRKRERKIQEVGKAHFIKGSLAKVHRRCC